MIKVLSVFGTRPEAIKMAPVLRELARRTGTFTSRVCVTGQHREMLDQVLQLFAIRPDYDLNVMAEDQTPTGVAAAVLKGLGPILPGRVERSGVHMVYSLGIRSDARAPRVAEEEMEKLDRITINPDLCLGQPTVRGMRITVSVVLKMLASGKSVQEVLEAYPELEAEDVRQAMQYAAWVVSDQIHLVPAG
jgi:uncharacterized protein (DUF433 family)